MKQTASRAGADSQGTIREKIRKQKLQKCGDRKD
jgi:hypothetical protein